MLQFLRITGFIEGISYLLLLGVTMPIKYMMDIPEPSYYMGMAHGVLFVLYIMLAVLVAYQKEWNFKILFFVLAASLLPFATFIADAKIFRHADNPEFKRL